MGLTPMQEKAAHARAAIKPEHLHRGPSSEAHRDGMRRAMYQRAGRPATANTCRCGARATHTGMCAKHYQQWRRDNGFDQTLSTWYVKQWRLRQKKKLAAAAQEAKRGADKAIRVYRAEKRRSAKRAALVMREAKETFDRMMAAAAIKGRGGRPRKAK